LRWWTCWLVVARFLRCCRRLGVLRLWRWQGELESVAGEKGFGFGQRFGVNLHLGGIARVVFGLRTQWVPNDGTK
jgi:hypothetical protein